MNSVFIVFVKFFSGERVKYKQVNEGASQPKQVYEGAS